MTTRRITRMKVVRNRVERMYVYMSPWLRTFTALLAALLVSEYLHILTP